MESLYPHPIPCYMVAATNQRDNPDLGDEGGSTSVYDWIEVETGAVIFEGVGWEFGRYRLPWGAMWHDLNTRPHNYLPHPGANLYVMTPCGPWAIDSRASNCGLPDDDLHHCWVRHGAPPFVTVDIDGRTCPSGGAGSLRCSVWHGFLRDGVLVPI